MKGFDDIDWARVTKRLRLYAYSVCGLKTFDCGLDAEDVVQETLAAFCDDENAMGWTPANGNPLPLLYTVLSRKAKDHFRRQKKVAGSLDDESLNVPRPKGTPSRSPIQQVALPDTLAKVYSLLDGKQDLRDFVAAIELTSGGHEVNKELAEVLNTTPTKVVNLRRRLLQVQGMATLLKERLT